MFDLIIIGGGPAAVAAGVYAARKKLKTLLLTINFESQSFVSDKIENWIGTPSISGFDLAQNLEKHLRAQEGLAIRTDTKVTRIQALKCSEGKHGCDFTVSTEAGESFDAKAVIIASGGRRRRLGVPGEAPFEGKGVAFCATCDAPLFAGMDVAVVGSGNSGLEAVIDLLPYAKKISLIVRGAHLKGDPVAQEEIKKNPHVEIIWNAEVREIIGESVVSALRLEDNQTKAQRVLAVGGVFVEIGSVPNTEMVGSLVERNAYAEIIVDHRTGATSHPGLFAAGDVTDDIYKQNNIAAGDGIRAVLSAYAYLLQIKKETPAADALPE